MFNKIKEIKEQKRRAEEKAELEKKLKEKALINKTLRNLEGMIKKYEAQKEEFIQLARRAEQFNYTAQYNLAKNGLKLIMDSYDRANQMYLSLTISNRLKETFSDTKAFVDSMSTISKQLSELQSTIDIEGAQNEYLMAMQNINQAEEKLQEFSDGICNAATDMTEGFKGDAKLDEALSALIRSTDGGISVPASPVSENNSEIDRKISELEGLINECR